MRGEGPLSALPLSEAPDTEQSGDAPTFSDRAPDALRRFADESSSAPDKTIAEDGEPASLRHARASGLEKPVPTPLELASNAAAPIVVEAPPPPFAPAPERLSAPESWLRPSDRSAGAKIPEADATHLDVRPPAMDDPTGPPPPAAERTLDDVPEEAKRALAGALPADVARAPLPKGTTAPHILPGHAVVEQMLSIRTVSSVPIAIASTAGRVLLAMVLSAAAGVGYGFLRQQVGPDLVKALSLDPRGQVLNVAFGVLFVLTSFAFAYGLFAATSKGWRRPKWRKA